MLYIFSTHYVYFSALQNAEANSAYVKAASAKKKKKTIESQLHFIIFLIISVPSPQSPHVSVLLVSKYPDRIKA